MSETRGRVLLVEDEETLIATLGELIRRRGHQCEIATSVEEGLTLLQEPFDAVITDIHLPDGNNLEMLEAIEQLPDAPPVIIITGYPSLENAVHAIDRHAFAYRIKPFDFTELLGLVDQAIGQGRLRRHIHHSADRVGNLARELNRLSNNTSSSCRKGLEQTVTDYLLLLLGSNAEALAEIMEILQSMDCVAGDTPIRKISRHPDAEMFKAAVEHTVKVLDATRRSFKSRELADLRHQLEVALAAAQGSPGST